MNELETYNSEVARGLCHTPEWKMRMEQRQREYKAKMEYNAKMGYGVGLFSQRPYGWLDGEIRRRRM